jgi:hypothetical protein
MELVSVTGKKIGEASQSVAEGQNQFLLEQAARRSLNRVVHGRPLGDGIYLEVHPTDVTMKDNRPMLNNLNFKILAVGPEKKDKLLTPGTWVQISAGARLLGLDWAEQRNVVVKEFEVTWIWPSDPSVILEAAIEKEKHVQISSNKKDPYDGVRSGDS